MSSSGGGCGGETAKGGKGKSRKKQKKAAAMPPTPAPAPVAPPVEGMESSTTSQSAPQPLTLSSGPAASTADDVARLDEEQNRILKNLGLQSVKDEPGYKAPPKKPSAPVMPDLPEKGFFDIVPMEVQGVIEKVLVAAFTLSMSSFVIVGLAIFVEAYAKSTNNPLPDNIDKIIAETLEPAFTPGLGVVFFCSSLLGVFKLGQINNSAAAYREDD
ncbi:unnamed protein product [Chrysoparadoxa australica]